MIKKLLFSSLMCLYLVPNAWAESPGNFAVWTGSQKYALQKATIGINMAHMAGMVAVKKVEHGGYFCPVDFACETYDTSALSKVWLTWYYTDDSSKDKCVWLCSDGYAGTECATKLSKGQDYEACDTKDLKSWWSGITGGRTSTRNDVVKYGGAEKNQVVYGLVSIDEHSARMKLVQIGCKDRDSGGGRYETKFKDLGDENPNYNKLVCADGFVPNADGKACEPANTECLVLSGKFCSGYPEDSYDSSMHEPKSNPEKRCVEYRCFGDKVGFPASGGYTCSACSNEPGDPRAGVDSSGRCKVCQTGQYFQKDTCKDINTKYTRLDLAYGSGRTKSSDAKVSHQCWAETSPDSYSKCVRNTNEYIQQK